jgi:hypothetical protein
MPRPTPDPAEAIDATLVGLVQDTWAEVLGRNAVGPEEDFFEIGGSSLSVAKAVARLSERLGMDLAPRSLFEAPTPLELAELIAECRNAAEGVENGITPFLPDWVVPLQREGAGRPVFVFPAGPEETAALTIEAQVASAVGRSHPFWGFRRHDPALEHAGPNRVAALATAYVQQMRSMQGDGPFLLLANCAGGFYAWETARQLLAGGDRVAGLLFFEVPLLADFDRLPASENSVRNARGQEWFRAYRPQPLPVALTMLLTADWSRRGWWQAWRRVAETVETVIIPDHTTGIDDFLAQRQTLIAGFVRTWLRQAEERAGVART